ncbi:uncharacterized protein METZ01_LOCUS516841, partial [marine metagenome]
MNNYKVKFLDLSISGRERTQIEHALREHLESGIFVLGDAVTKFENELSNLIGRQYSVGVNTGTDALLLGIQALSLPYGSTVITTPFSWVASAAALCMNNLKIKFIDVGNDLSIDTDLIENSIDSNVSAIMAVHMHGNMCDMNKLKYLAKKYNLKLIED